MLAKQDFGWKLTAILIVALAVRLAAGAWWQQRLPAGKQFAFGDSDGYWYLARCIARGQPYEFGPDHLQIFRTPGYPIVLAPLFFLSDDPPALWGRAVSAVLSTAAVGGVAALAYLLFNQRTALVASLIAAVYPEAIANGVFVLSEAPFTPLMMVHLVCWVIAWRLCSAGHPPCGSAPREQPMTRGGPISRSEMATMGVSLLGGVAGGLATLMRPSWLLFVPFAGLIGLLAYGDRRRHAVIMAVMLAGLCLTMLPWWIRNYRVAGRFVPTSLQIGASLYDGISPTANGASDMSFVGQFVADQKQADAAPGADLHGLFEDRLDRRMRNAALDWAREHPGKVLALAVKKFARIWSFVPNAGEFQSRWLRLVLALTYTPVIALALVGIWRFVPRDWPYLLCLLPAVYFTCLHVIFVSSIRYRQPAMLPLIVLAAGAATQIVQSSRFKVQN